MQDRCVEQRQRQARESSRGARPLHMLWLLCDKFVCSWGQALGCAQPCSLLSAAEQRILRQLQVCSSGGRCEHHGRRGSTCSLSKFVQVFVGPTCCGVPARCVGAAAGPLHLQLAAWGAAFACGSALNRHVLVAAVRAEQMEACGCCVGSSDVLHAARQAVTRHTAEASLCVNFVSSVRFQPALLPKLGWHHWYPMGAGQ